MKKWAVAYTALKCGFNKVNSINGVFLVRANTEEEALGKAYKVFSTSIQCNEYSPPSISVVEITEEWWGENQ